MTTQDARPIKIEVKNLTKRFGDLLVLDDMNFTIRKGEFLAIVGPTGCGKTTFLNCLSKLMPTSEGDIYIDGDFERLGFYKTTKADTAERADGPNHLRGQFHFLVDRLL